MKTLMKFQAWVSVGLLLLSACAPATTQAPAQPTDAPAPATAPAAQPTDVPAPTTAPTAEPTAVPGPVVIGLVTDLSGRFVTFGKDIQAATRLAVEKINAEGGINGSLIEVEVVDTSGEPEQAVIALRELADKGVFAISGPLSSGEAEVVFAQAAQLQVPVMTGTANKEGITEQGAGWAFRNTATNTALYSVAMPAWAAAYGVTRAVLVFDEAEPVSSAAAKFAIPAVAQKAGIELVNADAPITFSRGQTDFSTVVQRIKDTAADGIILMSGPAEAGLIARELARQAETRPVLGHPAQGSNTFYEQGGAVINRWVLPSIFNPQSTEADTQAYIAAMKVADPEPPTVPEAANYYDNILILAQVMRAAGLNGNTSPDQARAAIRQGLLDLVDFDGVAGQTSFGDNGDADKTVYVNVVMEGKVQALN